MRARLSALTENPVTILAVFILAAFGMPVLLGLSWLPLPFMSYQTGLPPGPAHLSGYDNFSFAHVDWPWRLVARQALSSGEWPLWNPYASLGLPFPGQYQNQLFFPLEWLEIFLGPLGWNLLFVCKVIAAGLGTILFLGRIFPDRNVQLVGGIVYCFSAYFLWFNTIAAFINGAMLVPWIFWGGLRLFDARLPALNRSGTLGLFTGLLLLSGQPQISALCLLALAVFVLAYAFSTRREGKSLFPLFLAACAVSLGVLIAFVQLALFLEMIANGYSLHTPGAYKSTVTSPLNFLLSVWPFVFGQLMRPWDSSLFPDRINAEAWPLVVGTSGLVLLATGIWATVNSLVQRRRLPPAVLAMFVITLLVLSVVVSGILGLSLWRMPGLDRINFPRYVTPTLSLAIAVIVCWGTAEFARLTSVARMGLAASLWVAFAALALGTASVLAIAPLPTEKNFEYFVLSLWETFLLAFLVLGTLSSGLMLVLRNPGLERRFPAFVALCVVAEFAFFVRYGLLLNEDLVRIGAVGLTCMAALLVLFRKDRAAWTMLAGGLILPVLVLMFATKHLYPAFDPYQLRSPATDFLRNALGSDSSGGRVLSTSQTMIPNLGNAQGIAELPSLNPQQISTSASYIFKLLATHPISYTTPNAWPGVQDDGSYPSWGDYFERRKFYNQISVRYLVDHASGWLSSHPQPDLELAYGDAKLKIYEDKRALPRAYTISAVKQVATPDEAYAEMLLPDFDPTRIAVVEASNGKFPRTGTVGSVQSAVIDELKMNRVRISVYVREPSLVVLSDAFYPGWGVSVDGEPAQLVRVAGALRGVLVQAGAHKVVMTYRPKRFLIWVAISFVSAFFAAGIIILPILRSWRSHAQSH